MFFRLAFDSTLLDERHGDTYPCRVLLQVAASVLDGVGMTKLLQELHLFDDVLPFLHTNQRHDLIKHNSFNTKQSQGSKGKPG